MKAEKELLQELLLLLACIIAFGAMMLAAVHYLAPDPGYQIRAGVQAARHACHEGKATTAEERRLCRILQ